MRSDRARENVYQEKEISLVQSTNSLQSLPEFTYPIHDRDLPVSELRGLAESSEFETSPRSVKCLCVSSLAAWIKESCYEGAEARFQKS